MKEQEGRALAYVDRSAQEVAIAAGLSGDERMARDYLNDPYISFAKAAGLLPPGATEEGNEDIRQICKSIVLGTGLYRKRKPGPFLPVGDQVGP